MHCDEPLPQQHNKVNLEQHDKLTPRQLFRPASKQTTSDHQVTPIKPPPTRVRDSADPVETELSNSQNSCSSQPSSASKNGSPSL